jgi:hypothetical protein
VPIYRTLEGWSSLPVPNFIFTLSRVEVSQDLVFSFQSNEGGRTVTSVVVCESVLISIECVIFHCSTALCFSIGGEVDIALDS